MKKNSFGFNEKIRLKKDFSKLFEQNKKAVSDIFLIYICSNSLNFNRLAISVKKHIANAVQRNRIKRLIRETFRLNKNFFKEKKFDILVVVRQDFSRQKLAFVNEELVKLWKKLSII